MLQRIAHCDLIAQAKNGDRAAFSVLLYDVYNALERHIARRFPARLQSQVSADDILQETALRAFKAIGDFQQIHHVRSFECWLKKIADRYIFDLVKRRRIHTRPMAADDSWSRLVEKIARDGTSPSRAARRGERARQLNIALATLNENERAAVHMYLLENRSLQDVADRLDRSKSAVRSLIHRATKKLRESLDDLSELSWLKGRPS